LTLSLTNFTTALADWQRPAMIGRVEPLTICNALRRSFTDPSPILHRSFTVFKDLQCTTMQHIAFNASRGVRGYAAISSEGGDGGDERWRSMVTTLVWNRTLKAG